jgi:alkylhydroperoxidase family enzyme
LSAVLADYRSAPVSAALKATLAMLEKLTLTPEAFGPADVQAVRDAGVSDAAIEDALHVQAAFNTIVRVADAFDFHIPDAAGFRSSARMLLRRGYL